MDWHQFLKKYVWDENKTPYLVAVDKLHRGQADNEIFPYAMFLTIPAGLVLAGAIGIIVENGSILMPFVALYSAGVCLAALMLTWKKALWAALYGMSVPLVLLAYVFYDPIHPNLNRIDQFLLAAVLLLVLRYSARVVHISKRYPDMPPPAQI